MYNLIGITQDKFNRNWGVWYDENKKEFCIFRANVGKKEVNESIIYSGYPNLDEMLKLNDLTPIGKENHTYLTNFEYMVNSQMRQWVKPVTCDSCGNDRLCKRYPLGESGNLILCFSCFQGENNARALSDRYKYKDRSEMYRTGILVTWLDKLWYISE